MKLLLNVGLKGYKAGQEIRVDSNNGIPTDPFWHKRIKDSAVDICVEIIKETKKSKTKIKEEV